MARYCGDISDSRQALNRCFSYHTVMEIPFTKMHGLGNDFIVLDAMKKPISLSTDQIRAMADRHFGIGFDQLLLLEPPNSTEADINYRIFNADGGEVEQCGNGARCAALYLQESRQLNKKEIIAETAMGVIKLYSQADGQITVNMGPPRFEPAEIPTLADQRAELYHLDIEGNDHAFAALSMGNPHAVIQVENIDAAQVLSLGQIIESHPYFPAKVNVGFMQILQRDHIRLRVFERGVGETLACGTGACAAVVAGRIQGSLDDTVKVDLLGGRLKIHWSGETQNEVMDVMMTGPATRVFEGVIKL